MLQIRSAWKLLLSPCLAICVSGLGLAQQESPPTANLTYELDSGWVENSSSQAEVVISFPVIVEGADWMRLYFEEIDLAGSAAAGDGAILRMTALADGGIQEMEARHVKQWQNSSCYFNGDTVLVEVLAQPNSGWSRIAMRSVDYNITYSPQESICGPNDDRVLSSDPRASRILPVGCTGWLIDDCAECFLTAGHCSGNVGVAQFNVPLSNSNGSLNHPSPDDQYAVDATSMQSNGGGGVGNDWAYFGAFANSNTSLTPGEAAGATYILATPPGNVSGNDIRITGYGTDSSPANRNQVQQTELGPMVTSSGTLVQYSTDTTGGNSGSPVIWENTGQAIGIHAHGGCSSSGGQNSGTGIHHSALQNALASPLGICEGSGGISFPQSLPMLAPPGVPIYLEVELGAVSPSANLHYRLNGGSFAVLPMSLVGGSTYGASIPAPACGDSPEYYFSFLDPACSSTILSPETAPVDFYSTEVASVQVLSTEDFETASGWTTSVVGATSGAWERGVPVNDPNWIYDPVSDSDGSGSCYLTGNQLGNTDVDGGHVRLFSPLLDLSAAGVFVRYDYYLNLNSQFGADGLRVSARNNGTGAWSTLVTHTSSGGLAWRTRLIRGTDIEAAGVSTAMSVQLRFEAFDTGTDSAMEAGIDAFSVGVISCGGPGTNYCSTGSNGALISASGSASVGANNLVLSGSGLPANVNGLFFYGDGQANTPLGNGTLCISGASGIFRLQPVQNSGALGVMTLPVDLVNPPDPAGQVTVGSTWNYQLWFRDGGTSDLTDGLQIVFVL